MSEIKFRIYVLQLLVTIIRFQLISAFRKHNAVPEVEKYLNEVEEFIKEFSIGRPTL